MSDIFDTCKRCGAKHFIGTDGLCSDCRGDDLAAADIEDGETEFIGEDEVRCPWCGKRVPHEIGLDDDILLTAESKPARIAAGGTTLPQTSIGRMTQGGLTHDTKAAGGAYFQGL